jgi:hypothetical protein
MVFLKNRPKFSPAHFCFLKFVHTQILPWKNIALRIWAAFVIIEKTDPSDQLPNRRKFAQSGHTDLKL